MYKNIFNNIYCIICGEKYPLNNIKSHINFCKNNYETKYHINIELPYEYEKLFSDMIYGLYPTSEKIEELNMKLIPKSIKYIPQYETEKEKYKEYLNTIKQSKLPTEEKRKKGERPRTCKCPLCEKEFAISAWKIHIKSCKNKEIKNQQFLPKKYWKDVDTIVNNFIKALEGGNTKQKIKTSGIYDLNKLNEQDCINNDNNLIQCESCGRKFLPERINTHQKICFKHPEMFIKNKK